ncbi:unnamed protein product [Peronospora farinosa]|uniref:FYVE-type domain-containing protein n=1 Tax=Peronospora farinosa TaxID=134698 RepID=A0ABN8CER8_9STRA|nr:unnamed protein product [Peronospora farinosa]
MTTFGLDRCPQIKLTPGDRALYDCATKKFLQGTVAERAKFNPKNIDSQQWAFVKRQKEVSVFNNISGSTNQSIVVMVGTGLIDGRLEDVMGGLYCDTTNDFRTTTVLLGYDLKDGSVLNAHERRSSDDPFRFAGIKWFATRCVWGLLRDRDVLTYERMGTTTDAHGHELTYHTLQSIERPEWPATPGMLRQNTSSCYLYRRHKRTNKTEIFLWGSMSNFGSDPAKAIHFTTANTWLHVVLSPRGGHAKKFSTLMDKADCHQWLPSSMVCHVCARKPKLGSYPLCLGCHQTVCKECSEKHQIFRLNKSGRAQKRLFCAVCIKNVTGKTHLGPRTSPIESCYDTSECSAIGTHSMRSSSRRSICSRFFSRTVNFKHPPDVFRPCLLPLDDEAPIELSLNW